jgi:23S rRNA (cytosine1962-C5)-methyltransferase
MKDLSEMHKLIIKSNRGWPARSGHPWLFRDDLTHLPGIESDGAEAEVYDAHGDYLGRGLIAARSQIACRIYSRQRGEELDREFFRQRIVAAQQFRTRLGLPREDTDGFRLVYAEADRLPGLTIDKYADYLVIQTPTPGLDQRKGMFVELLEELFQPRGICERNDMPVRKSDCLPQVARWITGQPGDKLRIRENGLLYDVDPLGAMKTGHFFDQRANRRWLAEICQDKHVLDVFAYTGGFGLTAARHGAHHVTLVDQSAAALASAMENARLNGLDQRIEAFEADGLEALKQLDGQGRAFQIIVLDPPAFAKNKTHYAHAMRAYKRLNARALKMLGVGGYLLTCSCSFHISRADFRETLMQAAGEARRIVRIVREGSASVDHPIIANVPETEYLKAFLLEVVEKF